MAVPLALAQRHTAGSVDERDGVPRSTKILRSSTARTDHDAHSALTPTAESTKTSSPNYQAQRRRADLSARGRASARVRSLLGRPRPSTLCQSPLAAAPG